MHTPKKRWNITSGRSRLRPQSIASLLYYTTKMEICVETSSLATTRGSRCQRPFSRQSKPYSHSSCCFCYHDKPFCRPIGCLLSHCTSALLPFLLLLADRTPQGAYPLEGVNTRWTTVVIWASIAESQSESSIWKMNQSDCSIFIFHSSAIFKTAKAPEH